MKRGKKPSLTEDQTMFISYAKIGYPEPVYAKYCGEVFSTLFSSGHVQTNPVISQTSQQSFK